MRRCRGSHTIILINHCSLRCLLGGFSPQTHRTKLRSDILEEVPTASLFFLLFFLSLPRLLAGVHAVQSVHGHRGDLVEGNVRLVLNLISRRDVGRLPVDF